MDLILYEKMKCKDNSIYCSKAVMSLISHEISKKDINISCRRGGFDPYEDNEFASKSHSEFASKSHSGGGFDP